MVTEVGVAICCFLVSVLSFFENLLFLGIGGFFLGDDLEFLDLRELGIWLEWLSFEDLREIHDVFIADFRRKKPGPTKEDEKSWFEFCSLTQCHFFYLCYQIQIKSCEEAGMSVIVRSNNLQKYQHKEGKEKQKEEDKEN